MIEKDSNITCMSFNVLGIDMEGYLPVEIRANHIATYLNNQKIDLIGLQEAGSHSYNWTEDFCGLIYEADIYGIARIKDTEGFLRTINRTDGKTSNSTGLLILYRKERFELIESDSKRYTSTERQVRYFQWVKLRDKITEQIVYMTNTHWSINWDEHGNISAEAGDMHRTKQARELLTFWKTVVKDDLLFATGDYNCTENSKWIKNVGSGIYRDANEVFGWKGIPDKMHIDHIFINSRRMHMEDYHFSKDCIEMEGKSYQFSDHQPLIIKISYKN